MRELEYTALLKRLTTDTQFVHWVTETVDTHIRNDGYAWLGRRVLGILILGLGKYWDKLPEVIKWLS